MPGRARGRRIVRPHGQLRRSTVIGNAGVGALLDLPRHSVMVAGLDHWGNPDQFHFERVDDERTRTRLQQLLGLPSLELYSPPIDGDTFSERVQHGIVAWQFPGWFIAQTEVKPGVRPLVPRQQLVRNRFVDDERESWPVVPVRFVRACQHGHIDDIDWRAFAHKGDPKTRCARQLLWYERGASGDFVDIFVGCSCEKFPRRAIIEATKRVDGKATPVLGWCRGERPWLGNVPAEDCRKSEENGGGPVELRLLVRHASHAYFPQVYRAISIPEPDMQLRAAVASVWQGFLEAVEDLAGLKHERRKRNVQAAIGEFTDEQVLAEISRRRSQGGADARKPKQAELQTFMAVKGQEGVDAPESPFFARELKLPSRRDGLLERVGKVLLIERLREVSVQVGFTRFEAPSTEEDGELDLNVRSAKLALDVTWLPAVENRGEGIFVGFDKAAVDKWLTEDTVIKRARQLGRGYDAWATQRKLKDKARRPPSVAYVMLHSLSHVLINALAIESGYSASSIRERIYAQPDGYGVLLFTGTPDADGTLGGLVEMGTRLEALLRTALEPAQLCSNDPICASHCPDDGHDERFLVGAACHGCLLIPETSCEARNDFLDRTLLVPTTENMGCAFFGAML